MEGRAATNGDSLTWKAVAACTVLYAAASLLFCSPFLTIGNLGSGADWGDARLIVWTLAWHARWPLSGEWPLDAPFFAPDPSALVYSEPMIGLGLVAAPITAWFGPLVSFDVLRLVIPVMNALAMAALVWHYARDGRAAFVAGFALAFSYSQIASVYLGMIHLAVLAGFCLTARSLDLWWRERRPRHLACAVTVAGAQALVSWYAAVIAIVMIGVQLAWLTVSEPSGVKVMSRRIAALALAAALAVAAMWPLARPFLGTPPPSRQELRTYSLEPVNFLSPPLDTTFGPAMAGSGIPLPWDRRSPFVGVIVTIAAAVGTALGIARARYRRQLWALPLVVVGVLLALGPSADGTWRLFDLLSMIPGVSAFRVPGRMAVLVPIGLAMLAGIAVQAIPSRARAWVAGALVVCMTAENFMARLPPAPSNALATPAVFQLLQAEGATGLLVLPMLGPSARWPAEADYMLFAQASWTPTVNGYGRRLPSTYEAVRDAVTSLPGPTLGDALRFYGISHVIVLPKYETDGDAPAMAALDASSDFERLAVVEGDALYRVRRSDSTSHPAPARGVAFRTGRAASPDNRAPGAGDREH